MSNKDTLKFYEVDSNYIEYLKKYESKIPNFDYSENNKFVCGIVLNINDCNYYVPVSSLNKVMKTSYPIYDGDKIISTLRFSFMFPVPDSCCKLKDFDIVDRQYRNLLNKEIKYCNINRRKIRQKAKYVYNSVVKQNNPLMVKNCCNYELLEQKSKEYIQAQTKEKSQNQLLSDKIKSAQKKADKHNKQLPKKTPTKNKTQEK